MTGRITSTAWASALLALAALQPPGTSAANPKEPVVGVVVAVNGKPKVQRPGLNQWDAIKVNGFLYEGDTVKTGPYEQVALAILGGTEVRINENSEYVMESGGGAKPASLKAKTGEVWTKLLHGRTEVQIRSGMAVAAIHGTEADVDVSDRMTVKVYEGFADVSNEHGKQSLSAGQMTQVAGPGAAPQAPRAMGRDDYATWQNGIKPATIGKGIERLNKEALRIRSLELEFNKDGKTKKIKLKFEKK